MNRTSLLWAWGSIAVAVASITACQAIANLQTRVADPIVTGCFSGDSNTTPGSLPKIVAGAGAIRLANLSPSTGGADFCIRPSGTAWGRPFFRDNGTTGLCAAGLQYAQVTMPFGVGAQTIDVKAIPAGQTCDAAATSELDGIKVGDSATASVQSVLRIGGDGNPEKIVALPEEPPSFAAVNAAEIRVVNAIAGADTIQFGTATAGALPTTVASPVGAQPIPFGGVEPAGASPFDPQTSFDTQGYYQGLTTGIPYAISYDGQNAVIVYPFPGSAPLLTLYAIGSKTDGAYPPVGLYCLDKTSAAQASSGDAGVANVGDGGVDAGVRLDPPLLADCAETQLASLDLVTFNVSLYGANAPSYEQRTPYITGGQSVIAASTADVMCIYEACQQQTRDAINGVLGTVPGGTLKYAYYLENEVTATTPPTNFQQYPGAAQADPVNLTAASCSGLSTDPVFQCLEEYCDSEDGGASGYLDQNTGCVSSQCKTQFIGVVSSNLCFDCILDNITSLLPYATSQQNCTQQQVRPLAFDGQNPSMILSKYPFTKKADGTQNTGYFVFGSTNFRRTALFGQIQIDSAHTLDVYCPQLTSPLLGNSLPYDGIYANPSSTNLTDAGGSQASVAAYTDEQNLQAQQFVAWVKQNSGSNPAVILGDWHSSQAASNNGTPVTADLGVSTLNYLDQNLTRAQAANWTPQCVYCDGVWGESLTGTPGYDFLIDYLYNYSVADPVLSENLLYTDPVVTGISASSVYGQTPIPIQGPVSEYYAKEVRIKRPQ